MSLRTGNLFLERPPLCDTEVFERLVQANGFHLERIISTGQQTPPGEWLAQDWDEWVVLLTGSARILIEDEPGPRDLQPGDWIHISPAVRHRVESTCQEPPSVWLALHYNLP